MILLLLLAAYIHALEVRVDPISPRVYRVRYSGAPSNPFSVLPSTPGTPEIAYKIDPRTKAVTFLADGKVVSEDARPPEFRGKSFIVSKKMSENERYFGLGDKTGPLDRRDRSFVFWNTDSFGFQESTDQIYKSITFLMGVSSGMAYGIFLDNTYRSFFDVGHRERDVLSFGAEAGPLDYYFIYGPGPKRVLEEFTALVGRDPLPPLFSLGYQQCRYSYYPESRVREIAAELRKRKIPADVVYLDIDYQVENRPFTIDREKFPTFEKMVSDLAADGFSLVAITDLHLWKDTPGLRKDLLLDYVGKVWPGDSVFPDFTRKEARDWWGTLYKDFVAMGIRGFWNDMNEPAIFSPSKTMPLDVVHSFEGRRTDHREAHNVFGMQNARATYEGLLKLKPDQRPFVLTRAAFAGTQRYAATWTGDNSATWNHMRMSVPQLLSLGLSGYSFTGVDVGGFWGDPSPELLTRWTQLGAFNPMFRNHAIKGSRDREPWVDGAFHEGIRRRYIEERYRLLPYIYTVMEEASRTGVPPMRPLFLEFPSSMPRGDQLDPFLLGASLLVAPRPFEFTGSYPVKLPEGTWYDYWTGAKVGGELHVNPPLDVLPVYVRAGSVIPRMPLVQHTKQKPDGPLELLVFPGPDCKGEAYFDDGETFAYKRGEYLRLTFTCDENGVVTETKREGSYKPWFDRWVSKRPS